MSKRLYDKNSRFTDDAMDLCVNTTTLLLPLMKKYQDMGYCPRDISKVMDGAILDLELEAVLNIEYEGK